MVLLMKRWMIEMTLVLRFLVCAFCFFVCTFILQVNTDDVHPSFVLMQLKLTPEHPTYLWHNKVVGVWRSPMHNHFWSSFFQLFITTLLFGSPRLSFSDECCPWLGKRLWCPWCAFTVCTENIFQMPAWWGTQHERSFCPLLWQILQMRLWRLVAHDLHNWQEILIEVRIMLIPSRGLPCKTFLRTGVTECPKCSMERSCSMNCHHHPLLVLMKQFTLLMNCCKTHRVVILFPNASFWPCPMSPWVALLTEWNLEKRFMVSDWPSNKQMYIHFYSISWLTQDSQVGFIVSDYQEILPPQHSNGRLRILPSIPRSWTDRVVVKVSPDPWRNTSGGRVVYRIPLIIFMDSVSGDISKQQNKHFVIYMSNAFLPQEMLDQEFNVHFVTLSPHASSMELMHAMKESIM